jgi:hypothetical protein
MVAGVGVALTSFAMSHFAGVAETGSMLESSGTGTRIIRNMREVRRQQWKHTDCFKITLAPDGSIISTENTMRTE